MKPKFLTLKIELDVDGEVSLEELDKDVVRIVLDRLGGGVVSEEVNKDNDNYYVSFESVEWDWIE